MMEKKKTLEVNGFSSQNIPLINEADLKINIPAEDLVASVRFTENKIESSKIDEGKLLEYDLECTNDIENQNFEMKIAMQINPDSAVKAFGQDLGLKPEGDNRESNINEINVDESNVSDHVVHENIEACEMSSEIICDHTTEDLQIKILDVVTVKENHTADFENLGKENVSDSLIVDIMGSSSEILTAQANLGSNIVCKNNVNVDDVTEEIKKETSEPDIKSEKLEVSETSKIEPETTQDSCSSEIEEIDETCDIVGFSDDQHSSKTSGEVILEQKNIQVIENNFSKNDFEKEGENMVKPELNSLPPVEMSHETNDFEENIFNKTVEEKEKYIESFVNEAFLEKDSVSHTDKNLIVMKLTSDSKPLAKPEIESPMSALDISEVRIHCADTNFHKTEDCEKPADFDPSVISSASKASSVSQVNNNEMESSSRRRKPKCPVRSPFNFRQRSNIIVSMSSTLPKDCEPNFGKVASKKTVPNVLNKLPENAVKKIKKHIEPKIKSGSSLAAQNGNKLDIPMSSSNSSHNPADQEVKKTISTSKRLKVVLNLKEMTDVNTRYNASIAPQTRRLKMLADVHNSQPVEEDDFPFNDNVSANIQDDISTSKSSTGILKKRKASSEGSRSKLQKVTFADPLVEERLFSSDDNLSERILKVSAQINIFEQQNGFSSSDIEKISETSVPSSDEIPSSSEYQSSDNLTDYNHLPISPLLINCEESISCIIKDLTSPTWVQALMTLLLAKNIKTIGDLCKLNVHELKALPIKSPKISCLHKALLAHLQRTQEVTASKLNSVENWCSDANSSESKNKENEPDVNHEDEKMDESIGSEALECIARELLTNDRIGQLNRETLLALSKKCFQEVTKRLEDH